MNITYLVALYIVVAVAVALYVFVQGVLARPKPRIFTSEDQVILVLATLAVGIFWVLFLPGAVAGWSVQAYRYVGRGEHHWSLPLAREARVR